MSLQLILLIVFALDTVLVAAVALTSGGNASLNVFGNQITLAAGTILASGYLIGAALPLVLVLATGRTAAANTGTLKKWEEQDNKLMAAVQSDREKQLEAKVATLEAALKKALKK